MWVTVSMMRWAYRQNAAIQAAQQQQFQHQHQVPASMYPDASRALTGQEAGHAGSNTGDSEYATNIILVTICVMCAAFASGLTIGINSFDQTEMLIKARSGEEDEKRYAARILPVLKRHHLLLVSLLLWNALAAEALPIFLDALVPAQWVAIVVSVTLVLFVGEIIPAAILTGPRQLQIAYHLVPLVYVVEVRWASSLSLSHSFY